MLEQVHRVQPLRDAEAPKVIPIVEGRIHQRGQRPDAGLVVVGIVLPSIRERLARIFGALTLLVGCLCSTQSATAQNLPDFDAHLPAPGGAELPEAVFAPRVVCREQTFVQGEEVRLGDIASIEAPDFETERALSDLYITTAPRLGQTRRLNAAMVTGRLEQSGWGEGTITLEIPSVIAIEREARVITQTMLENIVRDHLPLALPHNPESVIIDQVRVPRELVLPPGEVEWEMRLIGARRTVGSVQFDLTARVADEAVGRATGSAQVDATVSLVEIVADLPRGAMITPDLLRSVEGTLRHAPAGALSDPDQAVGLVTTQPVRMGAVLAERMVAQPLLVRRGDTVTLIYESQGLRITDLAMAVESGAAGDEIMVQNMEGHRAVRALVTGQRTVRVLR